MAEESKSFDLQIKYVKSDSDSSMSSSPDPEIEEEELLSPVGSDEVLYSNIRPPSHWSLLELTAGEHSKVGQIPPDMISTNDGLTSSKARVESDAGIGLRTNLSLAAVAGNSCGGQNKAGPLPTLRCSSCQTLALAQDPPASRSEEIKDANPAATSYDYDVESLKKYLVAKSKSACSPENQSANNDDPKASTSAEDPEAYGWHQFVDAAGVGYVKQFKGTVMAIWAKDMVKEVDCSASEEEINLLAMTDSVSDGWPTRRSAIAESLQTDPKDDGILTARMLVRSNLEFNRRLWHELRFGTTARHSMFKSRKSPGSAGNHIKKGLSPFPSIGKFKPSRNTSSKPRIRGRTSKSNPREDKPRRIFETRLKDLLKEEEMLVGFCGKLKPKSFVKFVPGPKPSTRARAALKLTDSAATTATGC